VEQLLREYIAVMMFHWSENHSWPGSKVFGEYTKLIQYWVWRKKQLPIMIMADKLAVWVILGLLQILQIYASMGSIYLTGMLASPQAWSDDVRNNYFPLPVSNRWKIWGIPQENKYDSLLYKKTFLVQPLSYPKTWSRICSRCSSAHKKDAKASSLSMGCSLKGKWLANCWFIFALSFTWGIIFVPWQ